MQPVLALSARTDPAPTHNTALRNSSRTETLATVGLTSWSAGRESPIALSIPGDDVIASSPCGCLSPSCVNNRLRREPSSKLVVGERSQATHPDHGSLDIEQLPGVDLRRRVRRLTLSALSPPSHARPAQRTVRPAASVSATRSVLASMGRVLTVCARAAGPT